jgi:hypothetical protein
MRWALQVAESLVPEGFRGKPGHSRLHLCRGRECRRQRPDPRCARSGRTAFVQTRPVLCHRLIPRYGRIHVGYDLRPRTDRARRHLSDGNHVCLPSPRDLFRLEDQTGHATTALRLILMDMIKAYQAHFKPWRPIMSTPIATVIR